MAMHVFAKLSLGYLADRFAHVIGWSPVTKLVVISGVEGPSANLFDGMIGTVRSVQGCVMTLEPDRTVHPAWSEGARLRLTARHEGWTPFSLCLGPIAVVVEAEQTNMGTGLIAIGMATLLRRRDRTNRS
jgi:hypothetical protein